jgi:two-component system response regulator DesR
MHVLVADTQADVRSAVRLLLTHNLGMQVVGEVATATDLWWRLAEVGPDLLLLEWDLLGAGAGAGVARLRALYPGLRVIVMSGRPEMRPRALAAGADAFVSKTDSPEQLIETLRTVCAPDDGRCAGADSGAVEEDSSE